MLHYDEQNDRQYWTDMTLWSISSWLADSSSGSAPGGRGVYLWPRNQWGTPARHQELGGGDLLLCGRDRDRDDPVRGMVVMFDAIRANRPVQLLPGLLMGVAFGFLLQRGGVTYYDVIPSQLLLTGFTVIKVMLSSVLVGMIGIYAMNSQVWVDLHARSGALGSLVAGGTSSASAPRCLSTARERWPAPREGIAALILGAGIRPWVAVIGAAALIMVILTGLELAGF